MLDNQLRTHVSGGDVSLVRLVEPRDADPEARSALDAGMETYGTALNTWRALLHRPGIFAAYLPYLRAVAGPGTVPQRAKELAALTVALANHCRYSASHRSAAAMRAGLDAEDLEALARGEIDRFDEQERVAIDYARQLTLRPSATTHADVPQAVDTELLDRLRATFDEPQIVELTANIALWNALTRFHRVMDLPLDMPPPPPGIDAVL